MKRPSMIECNKPDKISLVTQLVAGRLGISEGEIGPDSSMDTIPAWDSFEHMDICLAFEKQFGIKLNMDNMAEATSIRALAALLP
jgi:acyl carrier protein